MANESAAFLAIASVGPAVASAAQAPEMIFEGSAASVLAAVGYSLWRLGNGVLEQMKALEKHRESEAKQWEAQAAHREAERLHWDRSRSGTSC